jgi:hypothetical protein
MDVKPVICTFTKKVVNPLALTPKDIDIRDIAHALALINRFVGHTPKPVSVAQHSVYVSRLVEVDLGIDHPVTLQALLHDASEAYLGDVSKWVKATPAFESYRDIEDRTQRMIYRKFGLRPKTDYLVENADRLMVCYEGWRSYGPEFHLFKLKLPGYYRPTGVEQEKVGPWKPWIWKWAEESFLQRFHEIQEAL